MRRASAAVLVALACAGCGSLEARELPPAAGPPRSPALTTPPDGTVVRVARLPARRGGATAAALGGRRIAALAPRARVLALRDARTGRRVARAAAGVGPTHVACLEQGGWCWVTDTRGDALLVFRVRDDSLELTRRVYLPGGPYDLAVDRSRGRLWVTLPGRNGLVGLPAHGRPHVVARHATVRGPEAVAVDAATGDVLVTGRAGELQRVPLGPA
jgi:hypothetical protein